MRLGVKKGWCEGNRKGSEREEFSSTKIFYIKNFDGACQIFFMFCFSFSLKDVTFEDIVACGRKNPLIAFYHFQGTILSLRNFADIFRLDIYDAES